mgnify:CR=1 FL=1
MRLTKSTSHAIRILIDCARAGIPVEWAVEMKRFDEELERLSA